MIALDTNALLRLLIEDDKNQAKTVQHVVNTAEKNSFQILILPEVLIETVWVLESVYQCTREDVVQFLETLISSSPFALTDSMVVRNAIRQYKRGGDFADLSIVGQAMKHHATNLFSFDRKLQKTFPGYVVEKIEF